MAIDSEARGQLGNVLSVLPSKLAKVELDVAYDFENTSPDAKNLFTLDIGGSAWISVDNPNVAVAGQSLYLWKQISAAGGGGGAGIQGITFSGVGDGVGAGSGVLSSYLDVETDPMGLEFLDLNTVGKHPRIKLSESITTSSNELVIMWSIPEGFRKGLVAFPDSFNVPAETTPTIFTQLIVSGDLLQGVPSYNTVVSDVTSTGFTLELSSATTEAHNSMNILVKTNEPVEMVGIPQLPVGWDWVTYETEDELFALYALNQLVPNSVYYSLDTNRMYILNSDTDELVYYQGQAL